MAGRPELPCHQGAFHRATLFSDGFKFDVRCKIAADNEIMLREFLKGHGVKLQFTVARFRMGGVSYTRTNRLRMIAESVYINFKVGIFFRRPLYQLAVLASNLAASIRAALSVGYRARKYDRTRAFTRLASPRVLIAPITLSRWWCASLKASKYQLRKTAKAQNMPPKKRISVTRKIQTPMRPESNWVSALSKWCATWKLGEPTAGSSGRAVASSCQRVVPGTLDRPPV